jgi:hypothetical protein
LRGKKSTAIRPCAHSILGIQDSFQAARDLRVEPINDMVIVIFNIYDIPVRIHGGNPEYQTAVRHRVHIPAGKNLNRFLYISCDPILDIADIPKLIQLDTLSEEIPLSGRIE